MPTRLQPSPGTLDRMGWNLSGIRDGVEWRTGQAINVLAAQVDAFAPARSRATDGTIASASHTAQNPSSDHEPRLVDANGTRVVSAIDITHDPDNGLDFGELAERWRLDQDRRIKYVIFNRRIYSSYPTSGGKTTGAGAAWEWRSYRGSNTHQSHGHISVAASQSLFDDTQPWRMPLMLTPEEEAFVKDMYRSAQGDRQVNGEWVEAAEDPSNGSAYGLMVDHLRASRGKPPHSHSADSGPVDLSKYVTKTQHDAHDHAEGVTGKPRKQLGG